MSKSKCQTKAGGYVALTVTLLTMIISLTIIGGFTFFATHEAHTNTAFTKSIESRYIAEGGIEDMVYRVVSGKQYSANETLDVGNGTTTLTVSTSGTQKTIRSAGARDNFQQNLEAKVTVNTTSVSFHYGLQVGDGGLTTSDGSQVTGNIYSNGNVSGSGTVTGDVFVAGGISATSSYSWETNDADQAFATTSSSRDIAQSFIATSTGALNKISVYLKKAGSPANDLTVHIALDNSGKPNRTDIASATIPNSGVGSSPAWIDVSFASPANLTNGSKYWIVLDYGSNSGANYWVWRKDTSDGYANNTGKYADDWSSSSAVWKNANADFDFKIWIGGVNTKIDGITIGSSGDTSKGHANAFVNVTVDGSACPNANCLIENPARQDFAITDGVIQDWKDDALAGGVCEPPLCDASGNLTVSGTESVGPLKIPGRLSFQKDATLIITGTIWIVGDIDLSKNCLIKLAPGYSMLSGGLITDGGINVAKDCDFQGSGTPGSYILALSAKNAPASTVIDVSKNSTAIVYYAPKGRIHFSKDTAAKEATGYGIDLDKDSSITYESGLANLQFSSGPSGGYSVDGWQQVP